MKKTVLAFLAIGAVLLAGCGKEEINPNNISLAEYEKLQIGMTKGEVRDIVGGTGERISTSKDGKVTTYVYRVEGEQGGSAELTFYVDMDDYDGLVRLKAMKQDGLK